MKKVLIVLLTLVMAISLVNLNNNYTKANGEGNATTYEYTTTDGTTWSWGTPTPGNNIIAGDTIRVWNASQGNIDLMLIDGSSKTIEPGDYSDVEVKYNVIKADIVTNTNSITILDGVKCSASISFDGTNWKVGNDTITDLGTLKNTYGIKYTAGTGGKAGTAILSKNLYLQNSNYKSTLEINAPLNIELNNDITIANTGTFQTGWSPLGISSDVSIDGNSNKLVLKAFDQWATLAGDSGNLTLKDINLVCDCNNDGGNLALNKLILKDNCVIELLNRTTEEYAWSLHLYNEPSTDFKNKYDIIGAASATHLPEDLEEAKRLDNGPNEGKYYIGDDENGDFAWAKYILIISKAAPTPKPDKKKGEMSYDSTAHGGDGAFVLSIPTGNASTPATAYIKNFEDSIYNHDHVWVYDGTYWQVVESGWGIETNSYPVTSNGEKYTKIILKKEFLNYLPKGLNNLKITLENEYGIKHEYYVDITVSDYVPPKPDPAKKDESCEKVIGPSWHWNNTKGVCEEISVVGTYTR